MEDDLGIGRASQSPNLLGWPAEAIKYGSLTLMFIYFTVVAAPSAGACPMASIEVSYLEAPVFLQ
jgi:hypothetical protein